MRLAVLTCAISLCLVACQPEERPTAIRPRATEGSRVNESVLPDHATVVRVDPDSGEILDVFPTGAGPLHLVVASGHIWTQNFRDGTLTNIDPQAGTAATVDVGALAGVTSDGQDLWVARDRNVIARLNGATGEEEAAFEADPRPLFAMGTAGFLAIGAGSVWLTVPPKGNSSEQLWRIDPRSGNVVARIPIGTEANPPFVHGRYLWVITRENQALTRIDMRSNERQRMAAAPFPWSVLIADGNLWIGHHLDPRVVRVSFDGRDKIARWRFETNPRGLDFGGGRVWVATEDGLHAIDPATNEVTRIVEFGPFPSDTGPIGVAYLEDSVWVSIE